MKSKWHFCNSFIEIKTFCGIPKHGIKSALRFDIVDCKKCLNKLKKMKARFVIDKNGG